MLWNLKKGRDYLGEGRFELAKEHFLFALASCRTQEERELIAQELETVDLLLRTQR